MPPGSEPRLVEVSDGVFAYVQPDGGWYINNTGFLVGRSGVISIDTCSTERRTRTYLAAIASVSRQPVRTLINTHHHGDHTYGNCLMTDAVIVAHKLCREEIIAWGPPSDTGLFTEVEWGALTPAAPSITYEREITVWSDELRCEVRHVGQPAHTTNDSIIHLPERSVAFVGDLVINGGTPFVLMGSVSGSIETLERQVRPLGAQTLVPGHGPVCGPEAIDAALEYLRFIQDVAREGTAAGLSPLEAAREADLGGFADLLDSERIVGNLYRAYAELDGAEPGAPIDLLAALKDMVDYNGGRPLTCRA